MFGEIAADPHSSLPGRGITSARSHWLLPVRWI